MPRVRAGTSSISLLQALELRELSRTELAHYAGENTDTVVALADTAAKAGNEEIAREEAAHIDLLDDSPPPSAPT